jgi:hypothetical protein
VNFADASHDRVTTGQSPRVGMQLAVDTHRLLMFEQSASLSHAGHIEGFTEAGSRVQGLSTRCAELPQPSITAVEINQAARARTIGGRVLPQKSVVKLAAGASSQAPWP